MEILAYIFIAVILLVCSIALHRYLYRKYGFKTYSFKALGLLAMTISAWVLIYYFYQPGTADNALIEALASLFVVGLGIFLPLYLLVSNIRKTNLLWGMVAFVFQLLATATTVIFLSLLLDSLNDD